MSRSIRSGLLFWALRELAGLEPAKPARASHAVQVEQWLTVRRQKIRRQFIEIYRTIDADWWKVAKQNPRRMLSFT